jgi:hypothetical protein
MMEILIPMTYLGIRSGESVVAGAMWETLVVVLSLPPDGVLAKSLSSHSRSLEMSIYLQEGSSLNIPAKLAPEISLTR